MGLGTTRCHLLPHASACQASRLSAGWRANCGLCTGCTGRRTRAARGSNRRIRATPSALLVETAACSGRARKHFCYLHHSTCLPACLVAPSSAATPHLSPTMNLWRFRMATSRCARRLYPRQIARVGSGLADGTTAASPPLSHARATTSIPALVSSCCAIPRAHALT